MQIHVQVRVAYLACKTKTYNLRIFRYYDRDRDNVWKSEEFKHLISDLRKSKKLSVDATSVVKETQETYKAMAVTEAQTINVNDFLRAVCDLKIRGTSHIFRSAISIVKYLKDMGSVGTLRVNYKCSHPFNPGIITKRR